MLLEFIFRQPYKHIGEYQTQLTNAGCPTWADHLSRVEGLR